MVLAAVLALGCSPRAEQFAGVSAHVDATSSDGGCAPDDAVVGGVHCTTDEECLAFFASIAPSGEIYAICFGAQCRAAERCTETHAGVADTCECGSSLRPLGCFPSGVCVRADGEARPSCVAACVR